MKIRFAPALALILASACSEGNRAPEIASAAAETPPAETAAAAPGTPTQGGDESMQEMQTHMGMMRGAGGDSLRALLPMHRQMAANVLARMNGEMRGMNMAADPAWTATVDSLRQDLTRMPEMGTEELRTMLPAHAARLTRLMEMHRAMMGSMKM